MKTIIFQFQVIQLYAKIIRHALLKLKVESILNPYSIYKIEDQRYFTRHFNFKQVPKPICMKHAPFFHSFMYHWYAIQ